MLIKQDELRKDTVVAIEDSLNAMKESNIPSDEFLENLQAVITNSEHLLYLYEEQYEGYELVEED